MKRLLHAGALALVLALVLIPAAAIAQEAIIAAFPPGAVADALCSPQGRVILTAGLALIVPVAFSLVANFRSHLPAWLLPIIDHLALNFAKSFRAAPKLVPIFLVLIGIGLAACTSAGKPTLDLSKIDPAKVAWYLSAACDGLTLSEALAAPLIAQQVDAEGNVIFSYAQKGTGAVCSVHLPPTAVAPSASVPAVAARVTG